MKSNETKKLKYEKPVLIRLGEISEGEGACAGGTSAADCSPSGSGATSGNPGCQNGSVASFCTATGTSAGSGCGSNGNSAHVACNPTGSIQVA